MEQPPLIKPIEITQPKPEVKIPESIESKVKEWTEKGKDWLAKLWGKTKDAPREVLEEIKKAPQIEKELVSEREETESIPTENVSATRPKLGDVILQDLHTRESSGGIGDVLRTLTSQLESGITPDVRGLKIADSIHEILPAGLVSEIERGKIITDLNHIGKWEDMVALVDSFELKDNGEHLRLINYNGKPFVVSEQEFDTSLKITNIFDPNYSNTKEYEDYLQRRGTGQLSREERTFGFDSSKRRKERYTLSHHLIIEDKRTHKVFDLASIIPSDWQLRYYPVSGYNNFAQDTDEKFISFEKIQKPEDMIKLFHEYGHAIFTANDDPTLYQEARKLREESLFHIGGTTAMPMEYLDRLRHLLARNEKGASARALWMSRMLKKDGIDLGVTPKDQIIILERGLDTYRKSLKASKREFR